MKHKTELADKIKKAIVFFKILFFVFITTSVLRAQFNPIDFESFTIKNGLSNNSINSILQTKNGYMWIATKDGLNRYDGQKFKIFKTNSSDSLSITENYIMSLYESRNGELWIGTWGAGLCRYDSVFEKFIPIEKESKDFVQCIGEDKSGKIWFGTERNGLKFFDIKKNKIESFNSLKKFPFNIPADNIMSLLIIDNEIWAGTWGSGIIKISPSTGKHEQFKIAKNSKVMDAENNVWDLFNYRGKIFVSSNYGLYFFDRKTKTFHRNPFIPKSIIPQLLTPIRQVVIDHNNRMWIGTYNYQGIYIIDLNNSANKIIHLKVEGSDEAALICDRIRYLYKDQNKNIWIGTEDGLNKFLWTQMFKQIIYKPERKQGLGGRVVSAIHQSKNGTLWVGLGGSGFDKIDLNKKTFTHIKKSAPNIQNRPVDDVVSISESKSGIIWIATSNNGLHRFNPETQHSKYFTHNQNDKYSIKTNWVQQVLETSTGLMLIGTNDGLQILDEKKEKFYSLNTILPTETQKLPELISVNTLYEDSEKNVWIGTWLNGLYRFNLITKKINHYLPDSKSNSISGNKISTILEDSDKNIWIGTYNSGLNLFEKKSGKFHKFTTADGLPNDVIYGILEDSSKNLWISTLNGLAKFNRTTKHFRIYRENDGLIDSHFNWHAYFKNLHGEMFFGGLNGLIFFNPNDINIDKTPPKVALTSFKLFEREARLERSLLTTSEIILQHDQNFFSIDFTALDMQPIEEHKFAYRLEGIDPRWVDAGSRTTAFYTDISYGSYKFYVKTCNADGIWSKPVSLNITILPAWWNLLWFKMLIVLLFLILLYSAYQYRVNQLLKIEKLRLSIASDLHDEIGSNLSSISVDSQALLQCDALNPTEKELTTDISRTATETMEAIRDIVWFINPRNDFGEDLLFKMRQTAAKLLTNKNWTFTVSPELKPVNVNLDIKRNLFLLYKEALTNIVKHSQAANCLIHIFNTNNGIIFSIEDDGIGFDVQNITENNGLRNMRLRAEKMNAYFKIESNLGKGTKIQLQIKL